MDSQDFQSKYSNFNFKRQHKGEIRVDWLHGNFEFSQPKQRKIGDYNVGVMEKQGLKNLKNQQFKFLL